MVELHGDYTGDDFTVNLQSVGASILEGGLTGIFVADYLQSVTPKLALGIQGLYQRQDLGARPETVMKYCARYKSTDWIATAELLNSGINTSYWRRLTDKVEAGVDCQLQFQPGAGGAGMFSGIKRDGATSVGMKYSFAMSTYRAQIDSTGKVACVVEKRVLPPVNLTFAAEIDQVKVR